MGSYYYKSGLFTIMLAAVFVDETLAKKIKYEPALTQILGVDSDIGIFAPITCVDENPFPDPSDTTGQFYYQCFWVEDPVSPTWILKRQQCPSNGFFDPPTFSCVEVRPTTAPPTSTTPIPTTAATTTTAAPTTPAPFTCKTEEGTFKHETDCTKYYRCVIIAGTMRKYDMTCPANSYFDAAKLLCVSGSCPATTIATTAPTTGSTTTATTGSTAKATTGPTTTPAPFTCTAEGTYPDPAGCTKYVTCRIISGSMRTYNYTCPAESHFDAAKRMCVLGNC
ncbi:probable endochitinase [Folsomia candida]|uniref:Putative endochitinase n=1 Tax=Folsomia candida TaxID=158441 RepID=A0A226DIN2_FOLCA|nr:probable endochitinase [Folsomia candida]OXA44838.1 putative endochitinase [Folsomia candida]